jgi:tetratricopeptide (TPR) repeat protein
MTPRRTSSPAWVLLATLGLASVSSAAEPLEGTGVMEMDGRRLSLSPAEQAAIMALAGAINAGRRALEDAALADARKIERSTDGRYAFGAYALELGQRRHDDALRAEALDLLIDSGVAPPLKLASYLAARGQIAFGAKDFPTANRHWTRLAELRPSDPDVLSNLAQVRQALNDPKGAAELIERAIAARKSSGRASSESWYRQRLSVAFNGGLAASGVAAAQDLVKAYPSPANWRDAIVVYRQLTAPTGGLEVDLFRLTRAVGALQHEAEYQRMAQLLLSEGLAAEAKSVLMEGVARSLLSAGMSPTREILAEVDRALAKGSAPGPDSLLGAGRYADAAASYAAALARPGASAAALNLRRGMALVFAGSAPEAEAAFRAAVAADPSGGYADLARFWLIRLARAPAGPAGS